MEGQRAEEGGAASLPVEEVRLRAVASQPCWVDVFADGERVYRGTLAPGDDVTWVAREVLRVRFGWADGVELYLNGVPLGTAGSGTLTREFRTDGGAS